jgi:hypothetical protein
MLIVRMLGHRPILVESRPVRIVSMGQLAEIGIISCLSVVVATSLAVVPLVRFHSKGGH